MSLYSLDASAETHLRFPLFKANYFYLWNKKMEKQTWLNGNSPHIFHHFDFRI